MNRHSCLTEETLMDLIYDELSREDRQAATAHAAGCETCRRELERLRRLTAAIPAQTVDGGQRGLQGAVAFLGLQEVSAAPSAPLAPPSAGLPEVLTIAEVAEYVRVSPENVQNLLHLIPHLVFDGHIRIRRAALEKFLADLETRCTKSASGISPILPFGQNAF